ncbi:uncharacterized protein LOC108491364 [Nannospalax galili]|uniref:uncharacterized protein LOC108491364 n=1 Tax=Nannospalax galili TaxID=1026970 RepID=UPI00081A0133|nr:uncharacterized protein LOC108491364 [Nannospalax galili]
MTIDGPVALFKSSTNCSRAPFSAPGPYCWSGPLKARPGPEPPEAPARVQPCASPATGSQVGSPGAAGDPAAHSCAPGRPGHCHPRPGRYSATRTRTARSRCVPRAGRGRGPASPARDQETPPAAGPCSPDSPRAQPGAGRWESARATVEGDAAGAPGGPRRAAVCVPPSPYRGLGRHRGALRGLPQLGAPGARLRSEAEPRRTRGPQLRGFATDCPNAILVRVCGQPRIVAGHLWLSSGRSRGGGRRARARPRGGWSQPRTVAPSWRAKKGPSAPPSSSSAVTVSAGGVLSRSHWLPDFHILVGKKLARSCGHERGPRNPPSARAAGGRDEGGAPEKRSQTRLESALTCPRPGTPQTYNLTNPQTPNQPNPPTRAGQTDRQSLQLPESEQLGTARSSRAAASGKGTWTEEPFIKEKSFGDSETYSFISSKAGVRSRVCVGDSWELMVLNHLSDPFLLAAEMVQASLHSGVGIPAVGRARFPQPILLNAQHLLGYLVGREVTAAPPTPSAACS